MEEEEKVNRIKELGNINVSIDGNSYSSDMIIENIKKVLERYRHRNDNRLFVNGNEIKLNK